MIKARLMLSAGTPGEVSKLERGITDPYPRTVLAYVRALGLLPEMYAVPGSEDQ